MTKALDSRMADGHVGTPTKLSPRPNTDIPDHEHTTTSSALAALHENPPPGAAESPWEHQMWRTPFVDHGDADIARWAV